MPPLFKRQAGLQVFRYLLLHHDPPSGDDVEFIRRGLPYKDEDARRIRQLSWLGVTDVVEIPRPKPERKVKARRFYRGAISISSDLLCSWRLEITRDECGEYSVES